MARLYSANCTPRGPAVPSSRLDKPRASRFETAAESDAVISNKEGSQVRALFRPKKARRYGVLSLLSLP